MGISIHFEQHHDEAKNHLVLLALMLFLHNAAAEVIGGNLTVTVGDTAVLRCILADPVESLTQISWKRTTRKIPGIFFFTISEQNGPSFANGPDSRITFIGNFAERDGTLQITNASLDDEGRYDCIFTLFPAGIFQTKIHLQILVPPVTNLSYSPHFLGNEEVLLATCTAAYARPPAEVSWVLPEEDFRKTTNSTSHENGTTTTISSLFGVPTRGVDGQKVECVVSSPALSLNHTTTSFVVQVFFPPKNVTAVERFDNTIECVSDGNPKPSFSWTRKGNILPKDDIRVDGGNLTILNVATHVKGLYQCEVSNPYGKENIQVYLAVVPAHNTAPWVLFGLLLSLNIIAAVWYFWKSGYFQIFQRNNELQSRSRRVPTQSESPEMESRQ